MFDSDSPRFSFDTTAFMSGQVRSKLWMISRIEQLSSEIFGSRSLDIWLLGGWYGLTALLIEARERLRVCRYTSFDIDPHATAGALVLNESLVSAGKFFAITQDASVLDYHSTIGDPDLIINTSVEHMPTDIWWERIPKGKVVVLQSNNMPHDEEVSNIQSVEQMTGRYTFGELYFSGEMLINTDERYRRFMIIGRK